MGASIPNPYLAALSRPLVIVVLVLAEGVVLKVVYSKIPVLRLGSWALLAVLASLAANMPFRGETGPAALATSLLVSTAAGYAAIFLVNRLTPPPFLLRVMILATAASYAVVLLALRAGILR